MWKNQGRNAFYLELRHINLFSKHESPRRYATLSNKFNLVAAYVFMADELMFTKCILVTLIAQTIK